jgi:hypothetical protein
MCVKPAQRDARFSMHIRTRAVHSLSRGMGVRKQLRAQVFSAAGHNSACSINYY